LLGLANVALPAVRQVARAVGRPGELLEAPAHRRVGQGLPVRHRQQLGAAAHGLRNAAAVSGAPGDHSAAAFTARLRHACGASSLSRPCHCSTSSRTPAQVVARPYTTPRDNAFELACLAALLYDYFVSVVEGNEDPGSKAEISSAVLKAAVVLYAVWRSLSGCSCNVDERMPWRRWRRTSSTVAGASLSRLGGSRQDLHASQSALVPPGRPSLVLMAAPSMSRGALVAAASAIAATEPAPAGGGEIETSVEVEPSVLATA
jgi:hypothetical protein